MNYLDFNFIKFETFWASLSATTQQVGIADLYPPQEDYRIYCVRCCPA